MFIADAGDYNHDDKMNYKLVTTSFPFTNMD